MPPRRILVIKQTSFAVTHGRLSSVMYDFIRSLPVIFFPFSILAGYNSPKCFKTRPSRSFLSRSIFYLSSQSVK